MQYYRELNQFPGVIGMVDGMHVTIDPPEKHKNDYIDRKNNVSIVVQAVCNYQKKFTDIFIGYPGSVHDAKVFANSPLIAKLDSLSAGQYLLGDSAYPCTSHLLVPFRDTGHLTVHQKRYNRKLSSARVHIEHSFGILKQRFRQLYHIKLKGLKKICHFIRACMVIHNMCATTDFDFEETHLIEDEEEPPMDYIRACETDDGKLIREAVSRLI